MSFVLDASHTLACLFEDEASAEMLEVLELAARDCAWVPSLWHLEIANALQIGVKRGRCTTSFVDQSLSRLMRLPINVDEGTATQAWNATLSLARAESLTLYDACYLELALRRALPLATRDAELIAAARRRGAQMLGS
ncbi:MAG: type II toxin-antitoxin system VapC family toxin [Candidatus Binataceae bacterium]